MPIADELILRLRTIGGKQAAAEIGGAEAAVGKLGRVAKFGAGVAGIGALSFGLADITKKAIDFQQQQLQLQGALHNTGQSGGDSAKQLIEFADALSTKGGFAPSQNIAILSRLVSGTVKVKEAMKDLTLITDISRRTNLPYNTILRAVLNIEQGRTTNLARLGIVIKPVTKATDALADAHGKVTTAMRRQAKESDTAATKQKVLTELWRRFGGATTSFSHGAAGAISNFRNAIDVMMQRIGAHLLPLITKFVHGLTDVITWLPKAAHWIQQNAHYLPALTAALAGAALAMGAFVVATNAEAFALGAFAVAAGAAAAIAAILEAALGIAIFLAIAAALYLIITHFKQIKAVVVDVFNWIKDHWKLLAVILLGPFAPLVIFLGTHIRQIVAIFKWFWGALITIFNWIKQHWKAVLILLFGPIGLAIVLIVNNFKKITHAAQVVLDFFKTVWKGDLGDAIRWTVGKIGEIVTFIGSLPGKVGAIAGHIWDALKGGLKDAINWIIDQINHMIDLWNATAGSIPILGGSLRVGNVGNIGSPGLAGGGGNFGGGITNTINAITSAIGTKSTPSNAGHGFRATGGRIAQGGIYRVGERGPEDLMLPGGAAVAPFGTTFTGGGGHPIENHVYLSIGPHEFAKAITYTQSKAKATR